MMQAATTKNMNNTFAGRCLSAIAAVAVGAGTVLADTLTWNSAVTSGSFTDPANWTSDGSHTTPQPGDTVRITGVGSDGTTWSNSSAFDTSGGGLTIDCAFFVSDNMNAYRQKGLVLAFALTGSGAVTKTGSGQMILKKSWTTTGTVTVNDGYLCLRSGSDWSGNTNPLGTGKLILDRSGGKDPQLFLFNRGINLYNEIEIVGGSATTPPKASLAMSNDAGTFRGNVTSATDFTIAGGNCNTQSNDNWFDCDVDAEGKTMYVGSCVDWRNPVIRFSGTVNCSIDGYNAPDSQFVNVFKFEGRGTEMGANLTLGAMASNVLAQAAVWNGTNVTVKSGKKLVLCDSGNLSRFATLNLESSAKLCLQSGVQAKIARLVIDGAEQPLGTYSASNLPSVIEGEGVIEVATPPSIWVGGGDGDWNSPSNWMPEVVPGAGSVVLFQVPVTNLTSSSAVDISGGGITVVCDFLTSDDMNSDYRNGLVSHVEFIGNGRFVKEGRGQMLIRQKIASTGGITVKDGWLVVSLRLGPAYEEAFGTNKITIDSTGGGKPQVFLFSNRYINGQEHRVTNDFEIVGTASGSTPYPSLAMTNDGDGFTGRITASGDFSIAGGHCNYADNRSWYFTDVDAPGSTMFIDLCVWWGGKLNFSGTVNCSIDSASAPLASQISLLEFEGHGTEKNAALTLGSTVTAFSETATWAGTNVTVAANKTLELHGAGNLSNEATLRLSAGSKVDVASGVKVKVGACYANGAEVPPGIYSRNSYPPELEGCLTGDGRLQVGVPGTTIVFR